MKEESTQNIQTIEVKRTINDIEYIVIHNDKEIIVRKYNKKANVDRVYL